MQVRFLPQTTNSKPRWLLLALLGMGVLSAAMASSASAEEKESTEWNGYRKTLDVTYATREAVPLLADVYQPTAGNGPWPGVLVVHGGGWVIGSKSQLSFVAAGLARAGFVAVCINYRLAPKHLFPAQWEDCREAVRWMRTEGKRFAIDPQWIGAFGYSAGGHLVALLGTAPVESLTAQPETAVALHEKSPMRIQAFVAGGAPCDFRAHPKHSPSMNFWLGDTRAKVPDVYRQASPAAYVSPDDSPALFFYGDQDSLVPASGGERMVTAMTECGVPARVQLLSRSGHLKAMYHPEALRQAIGFLTDQSAREGE